MRAPYCKIFQDKTMKQLDAPETQSASDLISQKIASLADWRSTTLTRMRELIQQEDPEVIEEMKWGDVPVWSHDGILCTGESYKKVVKLTFAKGASLQDPASLFNSSLDGKVRRAIDIHEGVEIDAEAFKALIREAITFNSAGKLAAKSKSVKKAKV